MFEELNTPQAKKALKGYAMKAVKSFLGHDGDVLGGNLYYNNRLVARVANDSWGGGMHLDIQNNEQYAKFVKACENLPKIKYHTATVDCDSEFIMDAMLGFVETNKEAKRYCKRKMVIITTDCKDGEYITIDRKYIPEAPYNHREQLKQKYGKRLVEIVNDRFL